MTNAEHPVLTDAQRAFLAEARVCRVASVGKRGPHVAPFCPAFDGDNTVYIETQPRKLTVRNLAHSRDLVLLVDDYSDDWSQIKLLSLTGTGRTLDRNAGAEFEKAVAMLHESFPQFRAMSLTIDFVLAIDITGVRNQESIG